VTGIATAAVPFDAPPIAAERLSGNRYLLLGRLGT
jgi:hypothetical protein